MKKLKIGDKVSWRGGFGFDGPQNAKVEGIDINCQGGKHGDQVDEVDWSKVTRDNCVVSLNNGHWAYGNQIQPV